MLSVVEAPKFVYNETSNDTTAAEGASVHLRCKAIGVPEPTIFWRRRGRTAIVLRSENGTTRGKIMFLLTMCDKLKASLHIPSMRFIYIYIYIYITVPLCA